MFFGTTDYFLGATDKNRAAALDLSNISQKVLSKPLTRASHDSTLGGAGEGTRTLNLRITNPMLYQLSYASHDPRGNYNGAAPSGNLHGSAKCSYRPEYTQKSDVFF